MIGRVVSTKMQKTVVVAVETLKAHSLYHKRIKHTKKLKAATDMELLVGAKVRIEQVKPVSGSVSFKVIEVVTKGEAK